MKQISYFLLTILCFSMLEAPKKKGARSRRQRDETRYSGDETFKDAETQKSPIGRNQRVSTDQPK